MTTRLTPSTEAAIRARHANHTQTLWRLHAHRDIGALLAELDAVRNKIERIKNVLLGASLAGRVSHDVTYTVQEILEP